MDKLFLITDEFPYGHGEKNFIIPELPFLTENYDVTIVSKATREARGNLNYISKLPDNVNVIAIYDEVTVWQKIRYGFFALFNSVFLNEIFNIVQTRERIVQRIIRALRYLAHGHELVDVFINKCDVDENAHIVIYSFWCTEFTVAAVSLKSKFPNMTLITRMLGYDLYNERYISGRHNYREYLNKYIDGIFFETQDGLEYYVSNFPKNLDKKRLFVSGLGVMPSKSRNPDTCTEYFELVSCSNVIPLKRVDLIIDALSKISKEVRIHWVHFGAGSGIEDIRIKANSLLGKLDNISYEFKGHIPNTQIMEYYTNHHVDCFITVSSTEGGVPVSVLEALSMGIPIIVTDVGGMRFSIDGNGILLPTNPSVQDIVTAITDMLNWDDKNEIRDKSYEIWRCHFNTIDVKKKFLTILESIKK